MGTAPALPAQLPPLVLRARFPAGQSTAIAPRQMWPAQENFIDEASAMRERLIEKLQCYLAAASALLSDVLEKLSPRKELLPEFRFGHAFPHPQATTNPVTEAGSVLTGKSCIRPRAPVATADVSRAEALLQIGATKRPIYAYVGNLHPKLGRIGFILSYRWFARAPHGVSRCDTGGLAGRVGGFCFLSVPEAEQALSDLTHLPTEPWRAALRSEVTLAFKSFRGYLSGDIPRANSLNDARQRCIRAQTSGGGTLDRRLWTWEARSFANITVNDVEAVALTSEAWKELDASHNGSLPDHVDYLVGRPTSAGVDHFNEPDVISAFERGFK